MKTILIMFEDVMVQSAFAEADAHRLLFIGRQTVPGRLHLLLTGNRA